MSSDVKRLYRSRKEKVLGGVCGGLGKYFRIDPIVVRIILVILTFLFILPFPWMVIIYLLMWVIVPLEPEEAMSPAEEVINTTAK